MLIGGRCKILLIFAVLLLSFRISECVESEQQEEEASLSSVLRQLESLRFENRFQNTLEENIFYKRAKPNLELKNPEILYLNNEAAKLLDLSFPTTFYNIEKTENYKHLCDYLTGKKLIPGSDPIAIPQTKM
jgi:hypothetical protein